MIIVFDFNKTSLHIMVNLICIISYKNSKSFETILKLKSRNYSFRRVEFVFEKFQGGSC